MKKFWRIVRVFFYSLSILVFVTILSLSLFAYQAIAHLSQPEIQQIIERKQSKIYDANGRLIETIGEKQLSVHYEQLPSHLINALLSIEDKEFFHHDGLNYKRVFGSFLNNLDTSNARQGGSTITQQLVKNLILSNEISLKRKIQEAYLALELEKSLSKEEILEFYFNRIYFEPTVPGIGYASQRFFDKEVSLLTLPECAMLVGLVKSPSLYSPFKYPDRADERKNIVLASMRKDGMITETEFRLAADKHVSTFVLEKGANYKEKNYEYQAYLDIVYQEVEQKIGSSPFQVPLEIETYIDTSLQYYLDQIQKGAVFNFLDEDQQLASAVIENEGAKIIGVIGGRNYDGMMLYNRAYQMTRQPASTMKPVFTYALAMEYLNYNEYSYVKDEPYTYPGGGTVHNADRNYLGYLSVVEALGYSRNTSTLFTLENVIHSIGEKKVVDYLTAIGLMDDGVFAYPYAIGGMRYGVSPVALAGAYAMLANGGLYQVPTTIKTIRSADTGEILYTHKAEGQRTLSQEASYLVTSSLKKVMDHNYYNIAYAKPDGIQVVGKTGTNAYDDKVIAAYNYPSNADRDVWFAGYSKHYTIANWTGFDEPKQDKKTYFWYSDTRRLLPKQIFKSVMERVERKQQSFSMPSTMETCAVVNTELGTFLANAYVPSAFVQQATFRKGKAPTTVLPLPQFPVIEAPKAFIVEQELFLSLAKVDQEKDPYCRFYGKKGYWVYYKDIDGNAYQMFFDSEEFFLPLSSDLYTVTLFVGYEQNKDLLGDPYVISSFPN